MDDQQTLKISDFGRDAYGMSEASKLAMINYGKVLMIIAGADGEVTPAEYQWLVEHQRKFGATDDVIAAYEGFNHSSADMDEPLGDVSVDVETWDPAPHLLYPAIQMCSADGVYAEAERSKVVRGARALGVRDDIVLTLHALIRMEKAVFDMRAALFHVAVLEEPA